MSETHSLQANCRCSCGAEHDRRGSGESGRDWFQRHLASIPTDIDTSALRAAAENPMRMQTFDGRFTEWVSTSPAVVLALLDRLAEAEAALRWIVSDAPHDGPDDAEDAMHDRAMVALALGFTDNRQGPQIDTQERP